MHMVCGGKVPERSLPAAAGQVGATGSWHSAYSTEQDSGGRRLIEEDSKQMSSTGQDVASQAEVRGERW